MTEAFKAKFDGSRDRKALFILLALAGLLIAYQMSGRPEAATLKKDLLAASFAPPYWVLVKEAPEAIERCRDNYPRSISAFSCGPMQYISEDAVKRLSDGWVVTSRLQRWPGEIRILSQHPDQRIETHLKELVPYIRDKTGIPINLHDDISMEESDIRIYSYYDVVFGDFHGCRDESGLPIEGCVDHSVSTIGPPQNCGKTALLYCKDYPNQTDVTFHPYHDYVLNKHWQRLRDESQKKGYRVKLGVPFLLPLYVDEETPRHLKLRELGLTGNYFKDVWPYRETVLFAPYDVFQVDGYVRSRLVPGEDYSSGRITQAECQIFWSHPPDVVRQFVTECILRSLGLVNVTTSREPSVLATNSGPKDLGRYPMPTEWDLKLLRLHYEPGIESGSSPALVGAILNPKAG